MRRVQAVEDISQAPKHRRREKIKLWAARLEVHPRTVTCLLERIEREGLACLVRFIRIDAGLKLFQLYYISLHQFYFMSAGFHEVALALRHAILPKHYGSEYKLQKEWEVCGLLEYIRDFPKINSSERVR
jgi:hypothetical protein